MSSESQPTQLLNNILSRGIASTRVSHDREGTNATFEDPNVTKGSLDSSSSSMLHSAPRYHFHGLAATQQTQHEECAENDEGSQKENTPSAERNTTNRGSSPTSCAPTTSPSKQLSKRPRVDISHQHLANKGAATMTMPAVPLGTSELVSPIKNRPGKAVSFQSPHATAGSLSTTKLVQPSKTVPQQSGHYYHDSLSQDSFGGPVSQDPEKQFWASAKQFHVPLSELGRASEHETDTQPADTQPSTDEAGGDLARSLLASAASDSGSSQSRGQTSQQSMDVDAMCGRQPDGSFDDDHGQNTQPSTQGFELSQPSSSYERLIEGNYTQPPEVGTQMTVDEEVGIASDVPLPATQIENSSVNEAMTASTPMQTPAVSHPATGSRSLASTVNKKWRLEKLGITVAPSTRAAQSFASPSQLQSTREQIILETQPSEVSTPTAPARHAIPSRTYGPARRHVLSPLSSPPRSDLMEIVPDSEPPLTGPLPPPPSQAKRPCTNGSAREHDQGIARPGTAMAVVDETRIEDDGGSDEDDDVPLAVLRPLPKAAQANKGKGKAVASCDDADAKTAIKTGHQSHGGPSGRHPPGRSWETGIPSSAPELDVANAAAAPAAVAQHGKGRGKGGKPASIVAERKTRSTSASSNIPVKKRRVSTDTDDGGDDDELRLKNRDTVYIPKAEKREDEEETEPAEERDRDENVEEVDDSGPEPSNRKRKRPTQSKAKSKTVSKASVKSNTMARGTPTSFNRPSKRLRSVVSTTSRAANDSATRVYALWKKDSHYYSGTVHSHIGATKFLVQFDDDSEDIVDVTRLRRRELKMDDEVILVSDNRRATVKQVLVDGATVEVDDGDELEVFDVESADVRIAGRTITKQWQDRELDMDSVVPIIKPKSLKATPSPSKTSILSMGSAKGRGKALNRTGVVITMSPGNTNWEQDKDSVTTTIKNNGGTVIEDWSHILLMDGKHSNSNKRWVAVADDVRWSSKEGIQRVFLLADDPNQKPKFLIALALGIPCLSIDWLYKTVDKVSNPAVIFRVCPDVIYQGTIDWQPFLLPAGFCESLGARVSQMVDWDWGNSTDQLTDIMDNQVASKLFAPLSILCVGPEFVPAAKSKRVSLYVTSIHHVASDIPLDIRQMLWMPKSQAALCLVLFSLWGPSVSKLLPRLSFHPTRP